MKVSVMQNKRGNTVKNQFVIIDNDGTTYFQSYDTIIAKIKNGIVYLDTDAWNYSRTTSRYRNIFLNTDTKTIVKNIKNGIYLLMNLN